MDEDTGEVVSIERNEIVLERDTVLDESNIAMIMEMEVKEHFHPERRSERRLCHHLQYPEQGYFQQ